MKPISQLSPSELRHLIIQFTVRFDDEIKGKVRKALELAEEMHHGQKHSDMPYYLHPYRVAVTCIKWGAENPDEVITALVHDIPEDKAEYLVCLYGDLYSYVFSVADSIQQKAIKILGEMFSERVAINARLLSNPDLSTKDLVRRAQLYTEHVASIINSEEFGRRVKLADFRDNIGSVVNIEKQSSRAYFRQRYENVFPLFIEAVRANRINVSGSKAQVLLDLVNLQNQIVSK